MKKMYVGNLPQDTREEEIEEIFAEHGRVRSVHLATDVFSGECRGFGFVEMEGHEARAAIDALNGTLLRGKHIRVNEERARNRQRSSRRGGRR